LNFLQDSRFRSTIFDRSGDAAISGKNVAKPTAFAVGALADDAAVE
jgi:hypothetical protein